MGGNGVRGRLKKYEDRKPFLAVVTHHLTTTDIRWFAIYVGCARKETDMSSFLLTDRSAEDPFLQVFEVSVLSRGLAKPST